MDSYVRMNSMLGQPQGYASVPRTLDQDYADGILPGMGPDPGMRVLRGAVEGIVAIAIFRGMSGGTVFSAETATTGLAVGVGVALLDIMVPDWSGAGRLGVAINQVRA